ncbi:hypothetical protein VCHENC02_0749B, partial [Vibrio harveyi]
TLHQRLVDRRSMEEVS